MQDFFNQFPCFFLKNQPLKFKGNIMLEGTRRPHYQIVRP